MLAVNLLLLLLLRQHTLLVSQYNALCMFGAGVWRLWSCCPAFCRYCHIGQLQQQTQHRAYDSQGNSVAAAPAAPVLICPAHVYAHVAVCGGNWYCKHALAWGLKLCQAVWRGLASQALAAPALEMPRPDGISRICMCTQIGGCCRRCAYYAYARWYALQHLTRIICIAFCSAGSCSHHTCMMLVGAASTTD
jgi:hypothetical protein